MTQENTQERFTLLQARTEEVGDATSREPATSPLVLSVKPGDLFSTSWGYDQTNWDFIVVASVSKTGKTATCQLAKVQTVGYSAQHYIQKPHAIGFGFKFRLKVVEHYDGSVGLRGSYPYCYTEVACKEGTDERPSLRFGGFRKVKEGEVFSETDSTYGH